MSQSTDHEELPSLDLERREVVQVAPAPRAGRAAGLLVAGGVVVLVVVFGLGRIFPSLIDSVFHSTTDDSPPPLLTSIENLSRYTAATGNFQVVVDLKDDNRFLPDFVAGERTLFVARGSIDAYVDFSDIGSGAVQTNAATGAVVITLPAPELGEARVDTDDSYFVSEDRGILDRLGDAFGDNRDGQQQVYGVAEQQIEDAADDTELQATAEANTRQMLIGLANSLGRDDVTVDFT